MRIVLHQGRILQLDLFSGVNATGQLATAKPSAGFVMLPDNSIAEPVEVFDDELQAHAHREVMRKRHPGEDFRVILNSDDFAP